jgi:hypothetical protein
MPSSPPGQPTARIAADAQPGVISKAAKGSLPPVPKPAAEHTDWAKRVLAQGWATPVQDRLDALRILDAAGVDARLYDARRDDDGAPPGARDVAAAQLAREQAADARERESACKAGEPGIGKDYADRGIAEGPGTPRMPGRPEPDDYRRGYLGAGHGAPSPVAQAPRTSPLPPQERGILTPVELPGTPAVAGNPGPLTDAVAVHRARVTLRPPIPGREAR